ncbi:hypothetical protein JXA85_08230 [Candidatus Woesearchaeota archaeon]|nr:hypothetical protein [Candidatus Woesearchaeota archaeon]
MMRKRGWMQVFVVIVLSIAVMHVSAHQGPCPGRESEGFNFYSECGCADDSSCYTLTSVMYCFDSDGKAETLFTTGLPFECTGTDVGDVCLDQNTCRVGCLRTETIACDAGYVCKDNQCVKKEESSGTPTGGSGGGNTGGSGGEDSGSGNTDGSGDGNTGSNFLDGTSITINKYYLPPYGCCKSDNGCKQESGDGYVDREDCPDDYDAIFYRNDRTKYYICSGGACNEHTYYPSEWDCFDAADNDQDGKTDQADEECFNGVCGSFPNNQWLFSRALVTTCGANLEPTEEVFSTYTANPSNICTDPTELSDLSFFPSSKTNSGVAYCWRYADECPMFKAETWLYSESDQRITFGVKNTGEKAGIFVCDKDKCLNDEDSWYRKTFGTYDYAQETVQFRKGWNHFVFIVYDYKHGFGGTSGKFTDNGCLGLNILPEADSSSDNQYDSIGSYFKYISSQRLEEEINCNNGEDEDGDFLIDMKDPDCYNIVGDDPLEGSCPSQTYGPYGKGPGESDKQTMVPDEFISVSDGSDGCCGDDGLSINFFDKTPEDEIGVAHPFVGFSLFAFPVVRTELSDWYYMSYYSSDGDGSGVVSFENDEIIFEVDDENKWNRHIISRPIISNAENSKINFDYYFESTKDTLTSYEDHLVSFDVEVYFFDGVGERVGRELRTTFNKNDETWVTGSVSIPKERLQEANSIVIQFLPSTSPYFVGKLHLRNLEDNAREYGYINSKEDSQGDNAHQYMCYRKDNLNWMWLYAQEPTISFKIKNIGGTNDAISTGKYWFYCDASTSQSFLLGNTRIQDNDGDGKWELDSTQTDATGGIPIANLNLLKSTTIKGSCVCSPPGEEYKLITDWDVISDAERLKRCPNQACCFVNKDTYEFKDNSYDCSSEDPWNYENGATGNNGPGSLNYYCGMCWNAEGVAYTKQTDMTSEPAGDGTKGTTPRSNIVLRGDDRGDKTLPCPGEAVQLCDVDTQYCKNGKYILSNQSTETKRCCFEGSCQLKEAQYAESCEEVGIRLGVRAEEVPNNALIVCNDEVEANVAEGNKCCLGDWEWSERSVQIIDSQANAFICHDVQGKSLFGECCFETNCNNFNLAPEHYATFDNGNIFTEGSSLYTIMSFDQQETLSVGEGVSYPTLVNRARYETMNKEEGTIGITFMNFNDWHGFSELHFDFVYTVPENSPKTPEVINLNLNYLSDDGPAQAVSLPIRDYAVDGQSNNDVWHHVIIPLDTIDEAMLTKMYSFGISYKDGDGTGSILYFDNFALKKQGETQIYCTGPFREWVTGLNAPVSCDADCKLKYWYTCDAQLSFGWTGEKCCGAGTQLTKLDTGYSFSEREYYSDSRKGCWRSIPVDNDKTVAEATSSKYDNVLFYAGDGGGKYRVCGDADGSETKMEDGTTTIESFRQSHSTFGVEYISDAVPNTQCTIKGTHYCNNKFWEQYTTASWYTMLSDEEKKVFSELDEKVFLKEMPLKGENLIKDSRDYLKEYKNSATYTIAAETIDLSTTESQDYVARLEFSTSSCTTDNDEVKLSVLEGSNSIKSIEERDIGEDVTRLTLKGISSSANKLTVKVEIKTDKASCSYTVATLSLIKGTEDVPPFTKTLVENCCPREYCWDGKMCRIAFEKSDEVIGYAFAEDAEYAKLFDRGFRCSIDQDGMAAWIETGKKYDWNDEQSGFCKQDNMCFLKFPADCPSEPDNSNIDCKINNLEPPLSFCTTDKSFIADHYCMNGNWTTRTALIASRLEQIATDLNPDKYFIYCDKAKANDEREEHVILDKNELFVNNLISLSATNDKSINKVCILKFWMDNKEFAIFGTSLNKNTNKKEELKAALSSLFSSSVEEEKIQCDEAFNKKEDTFTACTYEGSVSPPYYNNMTKILLYSENYDLSLVLEDSVWQTIWKLLKNPFDTIVNLVKNILLQTTDPLPAPKDLDVIYKAKKGATTINGVIYIKQNEYFIEYRADMNLEDALETYVSVAEHPTIKANLKYDLNDGTYYVTTDSISVIEKTWPGLTFMVRLE